MLTKEEEATLLSSLRYDPTTGVFTWEKCRSNRSKNRPHAGSICYYGYRVIGICGKHLPAHRVAWFMVAGSWPTHEIDHINGKRDDNRWSNLREASHSQNAHNAKMKSTNTSGVKGVTWDSGSKSWCASVKKGYRHVFKKRFATLEEARLAVEAAREQHHGAFASDGL